MTSRAKSLPRLLATALCVGLFALALAQSAAAQSGAQSPPRGLLAPGDGALTGFSGVFPPVQIPPGIDPNLYTFIDGNGASLKVFDLQDMGGAPHAQLVPARTPFTFPAAQIGQVFGVALDNQVPPNIYVSATSAYGLPIVAQGPDGVWMHAPAATPGAYFMPGLWGAADPRGGPGSIWKVNGVTGAVTLFATLSTDGRPNSGAALGNLAFDAESNSLFVSDRESGLIHRLDMDGRELARFDHGVMGRRAAGLPEVAFDPARRLDIADPAFRPDDPATWNYAAPERRVFGLAVRDGRLFYAVAEGLQVWSVAFTPPNVPPAFSDPAWELSAPPTGETEISKIAFEDEGRMLLAERAAPSGAFDFQALAQPGIGRVLRYQLVTPFPGSPRTWQPEPDEYALGFPDEMRNGTGGLALGYSYDRTGRIDRSTCGGFLWMTGDDLRRTADKALAERLAPLGPADVDGVQGNPLWTVRPMNTPPLGSYFLDYDGRFDGLPAFGQAGDMAVWRPCGPVLRGGWMLPSWFGWWWAGGGWNLPLPPPPPPLSCPVDQQKPGFRCCPAGTAPGPGGQCSPLCPNGAADPFSRKLCGLGFDAASYDPLKPEAVTCIGGAKPVAGKGVLSCAGASPLLAAGICPAGWSKQAIAGIGTVCAPSPAQLHCPPGQQVGLNGQCAPVCLGGTAWPAAQCCAPGSAVTATGQCCPAGASVDPKTGACGQVVIGCPPGSLYAPGKGCQPPVSECPPGFDADPASGQCRKISFSCLPGLYPIGPAGACAPPPPQGCVKGMPGCENLETACSGDGCAPPPPACPAGWSANMVAGGCCPPGQSAAAGGKCAFIACPAPGKLVGGTCCAPGDLAPGGKCAANLCGAGAPAGAAGACCPSDRVYRDAGGQSACCTKPLENGKCGGGPLTGDSLTPQCGPNSTDPKCCPPGYGASNGSCCLQSQLTSGGQCCPPGQAPGGPNKAQCTPTVIGGGPPKEEGGTPSGGACCMPGSTQAVGGACCPVNQLTSSGTCCPAGQVPDPKNRRACVAVPACDPRETRVNGACCRKDRIYTNAAGVPQCCATGLSAGGSCGPLTGTPALPEGCAAGYTRTADGACCANAFVKDGRCLAQGGPGPGPILVPGMPLPGLVPPPLRVPPPPPPVQGQPAQPLPNRPVTQPPSRTPPVQALPPRPLPNRPAERPPQPTRPQPTRPAPEQAPPPQTIRPILPNGPLQGIIRALPPGNAPAAAPPRTAPQTPPPRTQGPKPQTPQAQPPRTQAVPAQTPARRPPPQQQDPNAPAIR
ncbi:hypothetical protein [Aquabacter cavernae]|uniref:hypothetical protein n=1 Tax=Aquabacter cavernae TaxID=2496029 RepID=UPI000F8D52F8|nr:hypothetical protein [Aquabacter cavernae]